MGSGSQTAEKLTIVIGVPDSLGSRDGGQPETFAVIRVHNGKAEWLADLDDNTDTITIATDCFSVYAIVYKEAGSGGDIKPSPTPTPIPTPGTTETPGATDDPSSPTLTPGTTVTPGTPTSEPDDFMQNGNDIEKRKDLSILLATGKQKGSNGIKLTWLKWKGASGYEVYWSYCDGKKNYKKLKTVKATAKRTCTHKKLKKKRAYKYYIAAYKMVNGKKKYVAKSPIIHVAMKYEKRTNAKKITLKGCDWYGVYVIWKI